MAPWTKQWTKMPVGGGTKKGRDAAFRMKRFAKGSFPTGAVAKGSFPKGAVAMSDRSRYQTGRDIRRVMTSGRPIGQMFRKQQILVWVLTFFSYVCFHLSRKVSEAQARESSLHGRHHAALVLGPAPLSLVHT